MTEVIRWSPRQESNLDPTLRRHVHDPLCYGEEAISTEMVERSRTSLQPDSQDVRNTPQL